MFGSNKKLNTIDAAVEVQGPPDDTASQIVWSPNNNYFAITSWDKKARIWQMSQNGANPITSKEFSDHALSCDWAPDSSKLFVATTDGKVNMWDIQGGNLTQVAQHQGIVQWCKIMPDKNLLVTGSADKTVKYWDCRNSNPVLSVDIGDPFLAADLVGQLLVVGAGKKMLIYDLNNPAQKRDSPLSYQTRVIKCFPNSTGFVVSSVEGRVGVQYINSSDSSRQFVFKCHRDSSANLVYGINDMSFNNRETFATCGSDGGIHFWDKDNRTKVKSFSNCGLPVTCCAFNQNSTVFAYALGYDWYQGLQGYKPTDMRPHVYVMPVKPEDIEKKKK